jgi:DNA-binding MarR family transcriptional regulator
LVDDASHSTAAALSRVLGPLRRAVLRATRAAEGLPDLPDTHIEILRTVVDSPDISPKTIADQLGLARPTVSNLIQAMKRERLITLTRGEDDARVVHVTATGLARLLLNRYDTASEALLGTALDALASGERSAIEAALPALSALHAILIASRPSQPREGVSRRESRDAGGL